MGGLDLLVLVLESLLYIFIADCYERIGEYLSKSKG